MGTWMRIKIDFADVGPVEVRIELRGRNAGMAEQFLHDSEVRATLQEVCGEGVSQGVGVHPIDSHNAPVALHNGVDGLP